MSTTPPHDRKDQPAKTPGGWARAFGILSTIKKRKPNESPSPPVEPSTNHTGVMMNGDLSAVTDNSFQRANSFKSTGLDNTLTSENETFMSPISPHMSPGNNASNSFSMFNNSFINNSNAATNTPGNGRYNASRIQLSSFSSRMPPFTATNFDTTNNTATAGAVAPNQQLVTTSVAQFRNAKSPWQHRVGSTTSQVAAAPTAPSPWQGRRSRTSESVAAQPIALLRTTSTDRARRYRPNAVGLVGSRPLGRRYRRTGEFNPERVSEALINLKESFLSNGITDSSSSSRPIFAVPGKVKWGSSSRPSRLPKPNVKRQRQLPASQPDRDEGEDEEYDDDSRRKRRKKVSFDQADDGDNAVVTGISATPFNKTIANRKGTPMPSIAERRAASQEEDGSDIQSGTPASSVASDHLPAMPVRPRFSLETGVDFSLCHVRTFDPVVLDPIASNLKMRHNRSTTLSTEVCKSYKDTADFESTKYVRPPSPVKDRSQGRQDDAHQASQESKRTKTSHKNAEEKPLEWSCSSCSQINDNDETVCINCKKIRSTTTASGGWGDVFKHLIENKWKCDVCGVYNDMSLDRCSSCESPKGAKGQSKPDDAEAGAAGQAPPPATTSTPIPASSSKFIFGAPTPNLPVPNGDSTKPTTPFVFGTGAPATGTVTTTTTSGAFSGGFKFESSSAAAPAPSTSTGFVFSGAQSESSEEKKKENDSEKSPKVSFGSSPVFSAPPPAVTNAFGSAKPADRREDSVQGTGSAAPTSSLSATAKPFSFTGSLGENGDKKTAEFGKSDSHQSGESSSSAQNAFTFGSAPGGNHATTSAPAQAPAPPLFSLSKDGNQTPAAAPRFVFGEKKDESATMSSAPAPSNFTFGQTQAPATVLFGQASSNGTNGNSFAPGAMTTTTAEPPSTDKKVKKQRGYDLDSSSTINSKPNFGSSQGPPFGFVGSGGEINKNAQAPADSSTPATASATDFGASFGSSSTPAPSFGQTSSDNAPAPSFGGGQTSSAAPAPTLFGTTPASSSSSGFGAKATSFGSSVATPAPGGFGGGQSTTSSAAAFGSTSAPVTGLYGFGGQSQSNNAPAAAFGSSTTAPAPGFGVSTAPPFGQNNNAPAPSFGSSATPALTPGGFGTSFGSTNPSTASGGFGGSATTGFGPVNTAANAFGSAPAPPIANAFGSTSTPAPGFGGAFGSTPGNAGGFTSVAQPSNAFGSGGFGGGSTPAPATGFGNNFGNFATPAQPPGGAFGSDFGANTAPPMQPIGFAAAAAGDAGFSLGTTDTTKAKTQRRRMIRAKRPTRPA